MPKEEMVNADSGRWIPLEMLKASRKEADPIEQEEGVHFKLLVSPYDIPEAVRGTYNKEAGVLTIEFKYLGGTEPLKKLPIDQHVTLLVGEMSDRVQKILFNVEALGTDQVALTIVRATQQAIANLSRKPDLKDRRRNYRLVQEAVSSTSNELAKIPA